jgi:GntR family transcriptional regulator/MocR family aminotransferase
VLVRAVRLQIGNMLEIVGAEAGMHLAALLPPGVSDAEISRAAASRGICATPLSTCYLSPPPRGGLILGYGGTNEQQIRDGVRKLNMSLSEHSE